MFSAYPKPFIIIFGQTAAKVIYPAIVWFWVLIKGIKYTSVLFSHWHTKAFLVPDSCTETERNGNSVSADVTYDTIEND